MRFSEREFQARGDDGTLFTVIERQQIGDFRGLNGKTGHFKGVTDYILSDGRDVSPEGGSVYRIVNTDEIIREI